MFHILSVTFICLTAIQITRAWLPLLYSFAEEIGFQNIPIFVLIVSCVPIIGVLLKRFSAQGVVIVGTYLAVLRVTIQLLPMHFAIMFVGVSLFLVLLPLAVIDIRKSMYANHFLCGLVLAMAMDTTLQTFYHTWDYIWQRDYLSLTVTIIIAMTTIYCVWKRKRQQQSPLLCIPWWMASYFAVQTILLHNIAFVAAATTSSIFTASAVILVADALAICTLFFPLKVSMRIPMTVITVCSVYCLLNEQLVFPALIAAQIASNCLLRIYLNPKASQTENVYFSYVSALLICVLYALTILLYQLHYESPLPFSNMWLFVIPLAIVPIFPVNKKQKHMRDNTAVTVVAVIFIATIFVIVFGSLQNEATENIQAKTQFKMVCYNIHEAVNAKGQLDPEAIAQIIEQNQVQVVLLQEVGRGWPISGMIDLAHWFQHRLQMKMVYAPAASVQFGNAILSNIKMSEKSHKILPQGTGSMKRSYVHACLQVGKQHVHVVNTHLQHKKKNTLVRIQQINALLNDWNVTPYTIIAGDLNSQPNGEEMKLFSPKRWISAQDVTGYKYPFTFEKGKNARMRIDWILGSNDLLFRDFYIVKSDASDHLPLFTTVTVKD